MKKRERLYQRLIRMALGGRGLFTYAEIRRLSGHTEGSLHVTLHRWTQKGLLERLRRGVYRMAGATCTTADLDRASSRARPSDLGDISKHVLGSLTAHRLRRSLVLRS